MKLEDIKISKHAKEQYCLRSPNSQFNYVQTSVEEEIRERLASARPSNYDKHEILTKNIKDTALWQDDELMYVIKDYTLVTVLSIPGADKVSDFLREVIIKKREKWR